MYTKPNFCSQPARCEVTDEMLSLIDVLVDGNSSPRSTIFRCSSAAPATSASLTNATRAAGHRTVAG